MKYPFPRFNGRELSLTKDGSKIVSRQALEEISSWLVSEIARVEKGTDFDDGNARVAINEIRSRLQRFDLDIDFSKISKMDEGIDRTKDNIDKYNVEVCKAVVAQTRTALQKIGDLGTLTDDMIRPFMSEEGIWTRNGRRMTENEIKAWKAQHSGDNYY